MSELMNYIPQICATIMVVTLGISIWFQYAASIRRPKKGSGYECFHCGAHSVYWNADFSFEDYGEEGEGIIHECTCANCGAFITYRISCEDPEEDEE